MSKIHREGGKGGAAVIMGKRSYRLQEDGDVHFAVHETCYSDTKCGLVVHETVNTFLRPFIGVHVRLLTASRWLHIHTFDVWQHGDGYTHAHGRAALRAFKGREQKSWNKKLGKKRRKKRKRIRAMGGGGRREDGGGGGYEDMKNNIFYWTSMTIL